MFIIAALTLSGLFSAASSENEATWGIEAWNSITVLQQSTSPSATKHSSYIVYNIGKVPVWAEIKFGTDVMWHGVIDGDYIEPGGRKVVSNYDGDYFITALKINNDSKERAIVIAGLATTKSSVSVKESPSKLDIDINAYAKFFAGNVAGSIPVIGDTLANCISFFWPNTEEPDVWEQIKQRVADLIDSKISNTIENLLDSNLRTLRRRVNILRKVLKAGIRGPSVVSHYMNLAQDLIGIEEGFRFNKVNGMDVNKLNYVLLPLFSTVITMKLMYYRIGYLSKEEFELSADQKAEISIYAEDMLDEETFEHIGRVREERIDYEYRNCHPDNLFNAIATVETFTAINGLEMIPLWTQWIRQPTSNNTPYRDTVILTTSEGRNTVDLLMEAKGGEIGEKLIPPILDKVMNGNRVEVRDRLQVLAIQYEPDYITSLTAYFESYDNLFHMGSWGDKILYINLAKAYLKRIIVFGEDIINGLFFSLSDGQTYNVGNNNTKKMADFQLDHHHIIGIFVGPDKKDGKNVLVNIAVSYLMDHEYDFIK